MKKIYMIFTIICVMGIVTGCSNTNSSESSESEYVVVETTQFQPSLSENEAIMRAQDAIEDKFDSIHPSLSGPYDEFSSWGSVFRTPEITYNQDTDTYTARYSDGACTINYKFMGVDQISLPDNGYIANFKATITIYGNGDAHVDNFNYDIVNKNHY